MADIPEHILYGETSFLQEVEYEENEEMSAEAMEQYVRYAIVETIGTDEFEETFLALANDLKYQDIDGLKDAYTAMAVKIYEVYEYEHPEDIELADETELRNYIDFVAFIEYDNVEFLSNIWYEILDDKIKIRDLNIEEFCEENRRQIFNLIESEVETYTYNHIIRKFLTYYPADLMIKWFVERSLRNRFNILFNNINRED